MVKGSISAQLNRFTSHSTSRWAQKDAYSSYKGFDSYGDRRRYGDRRIESIRDVLANLLLNIWEIVRNLLQFFGEMIKHIYQIAYGFFTVAYGEISGNGYA